MDDDTPHPGEPPNFSVVFVDEAVYDRFCDLDGPEIRALMEEIRDDPYPDGEFRHRIPDQPGRYFAYREAAGVVFKLTYKLDLDEFKIVVLATSVQPLPIF